MVWSSVPAGDTGHSGSVRRCAWRSAASVRFVPSVDRPEAVNLVRIPAIGNLATRQSAVEGGSGGREAVATAVFAAVAAIICVRPR